MVIKIKQGDSDTLTEPIEGLSSLSGYTAKLYIKTLAGVEVDTITGSIVALVVTYEIVNDDSQDYPIGAHDYESKIFDVSDHVYTTSKDKFIVEKATENNPS